MAEDSLIQEIKQLINEDNLEEIQQIYLENINDTKLKWSYIYQKIYLHACLKKKSAIVEYLRPLFDYLPPIQQIEIRQMFHYGNYLLQKK